MPRNKTRKNRQSPKASATLFPEGAIEYGKDFRWVVTKTKSGVKRWVPFHSTCLFGYRPLTADILQKHIGDPLMVYERQSISTWPRGPRDFDISYSFTASGDGECNGKQYSNWLKTRAPAVKEHDLFIIKGKMKSKDFDVTIQVAPVPSELVSTNLMNTDAFVKCLK